MKLDVSVTCQKCKRIVKGRIHCNSRMQVTDTDGGLWFEDGWTCHNCLGEPWASADVDIDFIARKKPT